MEGAIAVEENYLLVQFDDYIIRDLRLRDFVVFLYERHCEPGYEVV